MSLQPRRPLMLGSPTKVISAVLFVHTSARRQARIGERCADKIDSHFCSRPSAPPRYILSIRGAGMLIGFDTAAAGVTATAAGLMRGFAGFGSGMLMAPMFAILFGPIDAVTMVTMLELFVSIQLIPQVLKEIQWRF